MDDPVSTGLAILRVALGVVFLAHGLKHLAGREKTTNWFGWLGFKAPGFQWMASTATEIGVGILLVVGLLTGFAAAGVVGVMFVAFWTVHRNAGFFITAFMKEGTDVEGYEYVAVLALAATALAVTGPGAYAIDDQIMVDGSSLASQFDGWIGLALVFFGAAVAAVQLTIFWRPGRSDSRL